MRDDESRTTVSSLSYDPSEFDVDVLYSFATRCDRDINQMLIKETDDLIKRMEQIQLELPTIHSSKTHEFETEGMTRQNHRDGRADSQTRNIIQETDDLLNQIDKLSLPSNIEASHDDLLGTSHRASVTKNPLYSKDEEHRQLLFTQLSLHDEQDNDLSYDIRDDNVEERYDAKSYTLCTRTTFRYR